MLNLALVDDDHTDAQLCEHLCRSANARIHSVFRSGEDCIEHLDPFAVDALLVDLGMPNLSGPALVRSLRAKWPRLRIVIWTGAAVERDLIGCMRERINGYILKSHPSKKNVEKFATALHDVVHGCGYYLDSELYRFVFEAQASAALPPLSPREHQVLRLTKDGLAAKQIAAALNITEETVKQFSEAARKKCDAKNTLEAICLYRL